MTIYAAVSVGASLAIVGDVRNRSGALVDVHIELTTTVVAGRFNSLLSCPPMVTFVFNHDHRIFLNVEGCEPTYHDLEDFPRHVFGGNEWSSDKALGFRTGESGLPPLMLASRSAESRRVPTST